MFGILNTVPLLLKLESDATLLKTIDHGCFLEGDCWRVDSTPTKLKTKIEQKFVSYIIGDRKFGVGAKKQQAWLPM